jgi:hypothetical protein
MGLIAKAATKKRVQPMSGPVNDALVGSPWLTKGAIPTGALIRSSVFALNLTGVYSSNIRGRQSALASLLTPTTSSHLWVETNDFKSWDFVLGINNGRDQIAADWMVRISIDNNTATVRTTRWLTKDGVLVHGSHHDALREELLRAVALGRQTDGGSEADVSATSLTIRQPFQSAAPGPIDLDFSITTALDETASRKLLDLIGYRVLDAPPAVIRWGLGLRKIRRPITWRSASRLEHSPERLGCPPLPTLTGGSPHTRCGASWTAHCS